MSSPSPIGRAPAFWNTVTIVCFLGLLWLPTLDCFFKLDHARDPDENRLPAQWPRFKGLGHAQEFVRGLEDYFSDHFGFRKRLVRMNNHWKAQLFHDPWTRNVLTGRDGWLFFCGEGMMRNYTGENVLREQDLESWRRLLEMRRDWLRTRGIKYLFVIPPDKHSVYPEYLPDWLKDSGATSKVQHLVDYLKAHSTVEVLDLRPALVEAKQQRVTYLKTDTHWNQFGGFVAYRALMQALARQMPGLEPLPLDTYDWKPKPSPAGDLNRLKNTTDSAIEPQRLEAIPLKPLAELEKVYDPVRLPQKGIKDIWPFFTLNTNACGRAMVFHDSFACSWYLLLGQHFKDVFYIWQYEWNRQLIEREKPDVVIDEMLERYVNQQDPAVLAQKDLASETSDATASR